MMQFFCHPEQSGGKKLSFVLRLRQKLSFEEPRSEGSHTTVCATALVLTLVVIVGLLLALPALASHDPNTNDADCPSTWAPQYGVTCGDPSKPEACGTNAQNVPQCIATGSLPTGTCNNGSVRVNCDNCTASCACTVGGNIVCSGGSPATFGACQAPISCALAGRVTANSCTGACGGCAGGFEDLTPNTVGDTCAPIRPKITLAPPEGFPDADTTTDSSLYINKTGNTGNLARFQRGGVDRVIITNSGQLILGLASDWNTFTQTLGANENLIYGVIQEDSSAQSNVLLFQKAAQFADIPPQTLLRLDASGNLTVSGNVLFEGTLTVTGTINGMDPAAVLTSLSVTGGGLAVTGTGHSRAIALTSCAAGQILLSDGTVWNCGAPPQTGMTQAAADLRYLQLTGGELIGVLTITDGGLNVTGNVAVTGAVNATGCFGPVFQGTTSVASTGDPDGANGLGGYTVAHDLCSNTPLLAGSHVCSTAEILESIRCSSAGASIFTTSGAAWISNGPPGFTVTANDCNGWQLGTAIDAGGGPAFGAVWNFSQTGGFGSLMSCDSPNRFSCCR